MADIAATRAWLAIVQKAFAGNMNVKTGRPRVICGNSAPANALGTKVGLLYWDSSGNNAYICTVANTTWVQLNA